MSRHSVKLSLMFSIIVFFILVITMFITTFFVMFLYHSDILLLQKPYGFILYLAVVSIIIGTVGSRIIASRAISSITRINAATIEVAQGNFSVEIDENIPVDELHSMAHNFNLMTRELSKTEMLRKDFINNVSHEFKTPLAAIEGYATLLQNKTLDEEKKDAYIRKIIYNTRRLTALTGNILLLSRLENQEITPEKETFSLDEQIRQILLLYETQWMEKKLELDIDLDAADYCGNEELLSHVWQNLIGNAIKFSNPGGTISARLLRLENYVKVTIMDNGIGMDAETEKRIFEKFYQGNTAHTTEGNGLGLTLVKRIVDLHDGTIEVKSQPGQGTAFLLTLPLLDKSFVSSNQPY
ncbi:MAG: HAMP domain-containing histidine kinase [Lachnospiraceae bacterium]|nr:HAMP domain-containing histidine kinase [Lachnospiraceae bacterium]